MDTAVIRRKPRPLKKPFSGKHRLVVTCAKGILPFLRREIMDLGFPILGESLAGVETAGTFEDTLKLNLHLRTGQRVLFLLQDFAVIAVSSAVSVLIRFISNLLCLCQMKCINITDCYELNFIFQVQEVSHVTHSL